MSSFLITDKEILGFLQENIECSFESVSTSPDPVVSVFDRAAQGVVSISILSLTAPRVNCTVVLARGEFFSFDLI